MANKVGGEGTGLMEVIGLLEKAGQPFFFIFIIPDGSDCTLVLVQVVIVPIWKKAEEKTGVLGAAFSVKQVLLKSGVRVKLDDSDQRTPGGSSISGR